MLGLQFHQLQGAVDIQVKGNRLQGIVLLCFRADKSDGGGYGSALVGHGVGQDPGKPQKLVGVLYIYRVFRKHAQLVLYNDSDCLCRQVHVVIVSVDFKGEHVGIGISADDPADAGQYRCLFGYFDDLMFVSHVGHFADRLFRVCKVCVFHLISSFSVCFVFGPSILHRL